MQVASHHSSALIHQTLTQASQSRSVEMEAEPADAGATAAPAAAQAAAPVEGQAAATTATVPTEPAPPATGAAPLVAAGPTAAEKAALQAKPKPDKQTMGVKPYLEATVVPLLMQGMQQLVRERPDDPVEYLAMYLLKHNPLKQQTPTES